MKNHYMQSEQTPLRPAYYIFSNQRYNLQQISTLRTAIKKTPFCFKKGVFNLQEGHIPERRRASSCCILGLFSEREGSSL